MKTAMSCCLGVALWLGVAATLVFAQEPAAWLSPSAIAKTHNVAHQPLALSDWRRLLDLPAGTEVRVSLERARVLKGKLVNVTDEGLTLRLAEAKPVTTTVDSRQVVRVHEIRRDSLKNGTLIGLGIGAGGGAIWGAAQDPEETDFTRSAAAVFGSSFGAGVGALVGLVVDAARVELVLVYERSP